MDNLNFNVIYEMYFEQVYKYILKISSDIHIAEDITSETFMTALININKFKGQSSISTWLISIAKNKYISFLRKNNRLTDTVTFTKGQFLGLSGVFVGTMSELVKMPFIALVSGYSIFKQVKRNKLPKEVK